MTFNEIVEYILITAIIVVMSFVFFYDKEDVVDIREEPTMEEFYAFPLQALPGLINLTYSFESMAAIIILFFLK